MLFAVQCRDAVGVDALRDRHLKEHKDYLVGQAAILVLGGALLGANGEPAGSLYIVNVADAAVARRFSDADPFSSAGVFGEVTISAMRKSHWHPEVA
jgi:hypothetical protein